MAARFPTVRFRWDREIKVASTWLQVLSSHILKLKHLLELSDNDATHTNRMIHVDIDEPIESLHGTHQGVFETLDGLICLSEELQECLENLTGQAKSCIRAQSRHQLLRGSPLGRPKILSNVLYGIDKIALAYRLGQVSTEGELINQSPLLIGGDEMLARHVFELSKLPVCFPRLLWLLYMCERDRDQTEGEAWREWVSVTKPFNQRLATMVSGPGRPVVNVLSPNCSLLDVYDFYETFVTAILRRTPDNQSDSVPVPRGLLVRAD